jgi:hypothetical protein
MIKKILLALLIFSVAHAGPFDIEDNFINATPSSKWSDPGTGVTFYSGPNLEYRFDPVANSNVPWLQLQMPSAKIGCNGLSIKGGFMALLGLKDIKIQLTNAGPTFAWGVLTTIEISMPSAAAVFQKIQKWVRAIQNLLQNSCQAGQNFAKKFGTNFGLGKFEGGIIDKGADAILSAMDSVEKKLDFIDDLGDDDNDTKKALTTEELHRVGSGISFLSMSFGRMIGKCSPAEFAANAPDKIDFDAKSMVEGKVGDCDLTSKDPNFAQKRRSYILSRLLFGELVVTPESISRILEKFDANGKFSTQAAKNRLKAVAVARSEFPFGQFEYSLMPPMIPDARKAAHYLIHGSNTAYNIPNTKAVYIKYASSNSPKSSVVRDSNGSVSGSDMVLLKDKNGNAYSLFEVRAIYTTRATDGSALVEASWGGLVKESKKNILQYVKNALELKVGSTQVTNYFGNVPVVTVDLNATKTPLLVNGMSSYLNTITQSALAKGGVFSVMPLIDLLAQYNAQLFAEQLLSEIKKQIESAETGPNIITKKHGRSGFDSFRKRTQLLYNEMQKQIRAMKKETINDIQKVPEMFEKLERSIREKRINKTR